MIDPYRTPASDVVPNIVPAFLPTQDLTPRGLTFAAWLALLYAIVSIPAVVVSVLDSLTQSQWAGMASLLLEGLTSLMWIFLLILFRRFLEARFGTSGLGVYVKTMIALTVMIFGLSFFMEDSSVDDGMSLGGLVYFVFLVPYGVTLVIFARKLLAIEERYPYLRAFAWFTLISGVCMASVVLLLLAIPVGILADIAMVLLFFRAKREMDASLAGRSGP